MQLPVNVPLHELVDRVEAELEKHELFFGHSTSNAWEEAAWMGLYATGQDMGDEHFDWDSVPSPAQLEVLQNLVSQRIETQLPFAYIIREAWFCGLRFYVDERAIVPRSYFGEWIPDQFAPWIVAGKPRHLVCDVLAQQGGHPLDVLPPCFVDVTSSRRNKLGQGCCRVVGPIRDGDQLRRRQSQIDTIVPQHEKNGTVDSA